VDNEKFKLCEIYCQRCGGIDYTQKLNSVTFNVQLDVSVKKIKNQIYYYVDYIIIKVYIYISHPSIKTQIK